MESLAGALWGVVTAGGGTLALTLIVAIFLGISAMMLLFLGSAVVAPLFRPAPAASALWPLAGADFGGVPTEIYAAVVSAVLFAGVSLATAGGELAQITTTQQQRQQPDP